MKTAVEFLSLFFSKKRNRTKLSKIYHIYSTFLEQSSRDLRKHAFSSTRLFLSHLENSFLLKTTNIKKTNCLTLDNAKLWLYFCSLCEFEDGRNFEAWEDGERINTTLLTPPPPLVSTAIKYHRCTALKLQRPFMKLT